MDQPDQIPSHFETPLPSFQLNAIREDADELSEQSIEEKFNLIVDRATYLRDQLRQNKTADPRENEKEFELFLDFIASLDQQKRSRRQSASSSSEFSTRPKITRSIAFKTDAPKSPKKKPGESEEGESALALALHHIDPTLFHIDLKNLSPSPSRGPSPSPSLFRLANSVELRKSVSRFLEDFVVPSNVDFPYGSESLSNEANIQVPKTVIQLDDPQKTLVSRFTNQQASTILILSETTDVLKFQKSFSVNPRVFGYRSRFLNQPHTNWLCLSPEKRMDGLMNYFIISARAIGNTVYFFEQSVRTAKEWESRPPSYEGSKGRSIFIEKDGQLNKGRLEKHLLSIYPSIICLKLRAIPDVYRAVGQIEHVRANIFKHLDVGILFSNKKKPTIDDLISSKNKPNTTFYSFLDAMGIHDFCGSVKKVRWCNFKVNFLVGPQMDKQEIRQRIGNSMVLIIVHDSDEPFNPNDLFLGQVTNFVCVVRPVANPSVGRPDTFWRIGFFLHYTTKACGNLSASDCLKVNEEQIVKAQFGPEIPAGHIFQESGIADFIMTKLYNSVIAASQSNPTVQRTWEFPIASALESVAKQFAPEWHSTNVKKYSASQ